MSTPFKKKESDEVRTLLSSTTFFSLRDSNMSSHEIAKHLDVTIYNEDTVGIPVFVLGVNNIIAGIRISKDMVAILLAYPGMCEKMKEIADEADYNNIRILSEKYYNQHLSPDGPTGQEFGDDFI